MCIILTCFKIFTDVRDVLRFTLIVIFCTARTATQSFMILTVQLNILIRVVWTLLIIFHMQRWIQRREIVALKELMRNR